MKNLVLALTFTLLSSVSLHINAQVSINTDNSAPDVSAMLDIKSLDKGILIPRLSSVQRSAIPAPATGLMVFDTDSSSFHFFNGTTWINLSTPNRLVDLDVDTKIQVEENSDEDMIRFDLAGTEHFRMDKGRLDVLNTGFSVFIGEESGVNNDINGINNGRGNLGLGTWAMHSNTTGYTNSAAGFEAMRNTTVGSDNLAFGSYALRNNTSGSLNSAVGSSTLLSNITGTKNTALGYGADVGTDDLTNATAIGADAVVDQSNSLVLGNNAHVGIGTSTPDTSAMLDIKSNNKGILIPRMTSTERLAISDPATGLLVFDTDLSGFHFSDGTNWINLSVPDRMADTDADTRIQVEEGMDDDIIRFDMAGTEFFRMDSGRLEIDNTGSSVFIGRFAGYNDDYSFNRNVAIGADALASNVNGPLNNAVGYRSLYTNANGVGNNAFGTYTLYENISGTYNSGFGHRALYNNFTGKYNTAIGHNTLYYNMFGSYNTALGSGAGVGHGDITNATAIGANALVSQSNSLVLGNNANVGIGTPIPDTTAMLDIKSNNKGILIPRLSAAERSSIPTPATGLLVYDLDTATFCFYSGSKWINLSTPNLLADSDTDTKIQVEESGDEDIIRFDMGGIEFFRMTNGRLEVHNTGNSVFIGLGAGGNDDFSNNLNVGIGLNALGSNTTGRYNEAIGYRSLYRNTTGEFNMAIGSWALDKNTTGTRNTAIGHRALVANTIGESNTAIGYDANVGANDLVNATAIGAHTTVSLSNSLILGNNANVGIGTSAPTKAKLEIQGSQTDTLSYGYLNSTGSVGTAFNQVSDYSIYASDRIAASEFNAHSDARIKHVHGISNSDTDLQTLMGIEITNYTMRDTIAKGNGLHKKVIAQQVAEVYPKAVSRNITEVIPDIYRHATIKDGWITLETDLTVGEKVSIITDETHVPYEVLVAESDRFKVELPGENTQQVFVYGREVNDFHTVDYEAIAMLNVSATQELYRQLSRVKSENERLKEALSTLSDLELRMAELETRLRAGN